jgi:hypothetical protein
VQADRALVAVWVAKAMQLDPVDTSEMPYSDYLLISKEDLGYILALYKEGLMVGTPDGKFNPNSKITRQKWLPSCSAFWMKKETMKNLWKMR